MVENDAYSKDIMPLTFLTLCSWVEVIQSCWNYCANMGTWTSRFTLH